MTLVTETDLHAYLDGELAASRHSEVEAWLHDQPKDSARLAAYREQKEEMRRLFDPVLDEPIPDALRQMLIDTPLAIETTRPLQRKAANDSWRTIAAGLAIIAVSATFGWVARAHLAPPTDVVQGVPLPRQAAIAHAVYSPDMRRPVEVNAEHEDQLVAWLSKRIGAQVRAPKLSVLGYDLIGGRLLPGNSGPVAQLMYQDASGQRLTLFLSTENVGNRDTAFRFAQEGALNVFYWIDGQFGYALSGPIPREELGKIATTVYEQLDRP